MDEQPEVIEHEMEETRHSLAEKLGALEGQVAETVQGTTGAVADTVGTVKETVEDVSEKVKETVAAVEQTVETVKETVQQTVETMKETVQQTVSTVSNTFRQAAHTVSEAFDIRLQAQRRPWLVFGGSVVAGWLGGYLYGQAVRRPSGAAAWHPTPTGAEAAMRRPESTGGSFRMPDWLSEEFGRLKNVALGAAMGLARDLVRQNMPGPLGERIAEEIEHVNSHLGGEQIRGPLVADAGAERGTGATR
jgi:gas vesicle protein